MKTGTAIPTSGKAATRPHPQSATEESTQAKMFSAPQTQKNVHLESAPSWLPEKSKYRVQNCKKSAFSSPTVEGTTRLKSSFSEKVLQVEIFLLLTFSHRSQGHYNNLLGCSLLKARSAEDVVGEVQAAKPVL